VIEGSAVTAMVLSSRNRRAKEDRIEVPRTNLRYLFRTIRPQQLQIPSIKHLQRRRRKKVLVLLYVSTHFTHLCLLVHVPILPRPPVWSLLRNLPVSQIIFNCSAYLARLNSYFGFPLFFSIK
jgi:hypothetical protein